MKQPRLRIVPVSLAVANEFVADWHRHHQPVVGHRFSLGCISLPIQTLVGVAICGRPVARMVDAARVVEVTRLCTDGTENACSALYGASARVAKAMGFETIQTYILDSEHGVSLKAAGWRQVARTAGGAWAHTSGPRNNDHPLEPKRRYERQLNDPVPEYVIIESTRPQITVAKTLL